MNPELRLLIIAADPLVRMALANIFAEEVHCQVMGLANPSTAVDTLADLQEESDIDLLIWDWGWETGGMSAADLLEFEIPVLVLLSAAAQVEEAWSAGARAMVKRESSGKTVAAAAAAAVGGLVVIDPDLALSFLPAPLNSEDELAEELTPREMEVLLLLAEGLTNKEIAQQLNISQHTVKFHVNGILGKLNAQSRTEAVVRATRHGLLAL
jgi:two-component system nitrate/nitrite response regulator NarL